MEIEVAPAKEKDSFVFVVSIPSTPYVYGVRADGGRGVEAGKWGYFIRRPARVDELSPRELAELAKQRGDYMDNMKTRYTLLDTLHVIKEGFAELLGTSEQGFEASLDKEDSFRRLLRKTAMKNLTMNLVDEFYDLRRGIDYALEIPHGELRVEERELLKEIDEVVNDYAHDVKDHSSLDILQLDEGPTFLNLSVAEWLKYAVRDMNMDRRQKTWDGIRSALSSYGVTYEEFLREAEKLGIHFTKYYEEELEKHLLDALRRTARSLDKLIDYYESLQSRFGIFRDTG